MRKKQLARRDAEFKFQVVLALLSGTKTGDEICVEYGVTRASLYRWRERVLAEGHKLFEAPGGRSATSEQARIVELERMIGRLTMEVEVLKKASTMLNSRSRNGA
jgi:transposase-like protein